MRLLLVLLLINFNNYAKDLGVLGHTFTISEPDLLATLQHKTEQLTGEFLEAWQQQLKTKMQAKLTRPPRVANISDTKQAREFWFNPSIRVPYDLKDHNGNIIITAGTIVNPLTFSSFGKNMLFIDGDNQQQAEWAVKQHGQIILVNGAPFSFMQQYQVDCYFDQGGRLVNKLGIKQVPAIVSQEGLELKIQEVLLAA